MSETIDPTQLPAPAPAPELAPASTPSTLLARPARPLLGPTLRVYGALLWSYVIAGQFTTSWFDDGAPLGEAWATLIVVGVTVLVLLLAMRRSAEIAPPQVGSSLVPRTLGVLALAFLAFVVTLAGVTVGGFILLPGRHNVLYAFVLVVAACLASLAGQRMTRPVGAHVHSTRVQNVLIWFVLTVITLIAGAELVTNG
jgi:hypothetical protein